MGNFDWPDYLGLSHELLANHETATVHKLACWRTIVSRAYYAAFHVADNYCKRKYMGRLRNLDRQYPGRDHDNVRQCLVDSTNDEETNIGSWLGSLKMERKDADYTAEQEFDEDRAEMACLSADKIVRGLSALAAKPGRSAPPMPPTPTAPSSAK